MKEDFQGFQSLSLKYSSSSSIVHKIYIKEHAVREHSDDKPPGRTLIILNIPPFINENNLRRVFKDAGKIESILLTDKPSSSEKHKNKSNIFHPKLKTCFKVAYIVFSKKIELDNALNLKELPSVCHNGSDSTNGVVTWIKEYNSSIPSVENIKKDIESFMKKYDQESKKKLNNEKSLGEVDEEGWITVTRHSKKPGFERKETVGNKIMTKEKTRQQKRELKNFYTFQIRESKMKHIVALRQKFEEDKKKIALLKESRRFRPF